MSEPARPPDVRDHVRTVLEGLGSGGVLPPHDPTCLGCGPDAEQGFHLEVRRDGDDVVAEHVFEPRHSGAPGIAHGGPSRRSSTTCAATCCTSRTSPA